MKSTGGLRFYVCKHSLIRTT